jgi:hypothetical protein
MDKIERFGYTMREMGVWETLEQPKCSKYAQIGHQARIGHFAGNDQ